MNKTLLKTTHNKNYNKNYNFKKDLSLHLKSSREPASTTLLGKLLGIPFTHSGLELGMIFEGTTGVYERFCCFNSK